MVLRGLDGGGVMVTDRNDLADRPSGGPGPGSVRQQHHRHDLDRTECVGRHPRRRFDPGHRTWNGTPTFRQYTSNLGSLDVTAVTGAVIGGSERVFYGMDGEGLGQINSGLSGNIYTADQDGLISDDVTALQMFHGDLFVGTPAGISRFANNVFTDQNTGLTSLVITTWPWTPTATCWPPAARRLPLGSRRRILGVARGSWAFRWWTLPAPRARSIALGGAGRSRHSQ